jgi:dTDP-4-amino-4,6-dideoxygalactose transaminase
MNTEKLALFGGNKVITDPFVRYNPIGKEEIDSVRKVMETGILSKFLGCWDPDFYGGPKVQEFEKQCAAYFGVKHAVTVNSWTSGLIAAVGAIGIEPGDEVIVSPWTMCASATAILHWNAIPVFADIEADTFCLDPASVEANITKHTKAIMAIDIFGHSADMDALMSIAERHGLKVISDTAQAPGAYYKGKFAGTVAHVGGYSLNYHKHIHTGEGGILVTNDTEIAEHLQLIRGKGVKNLSNMLGYNFRLGEIECAIGIEQLKKLQKLIGRRQQIGNMITDGLNGLTGLRTPITKPDCTHVYYMYPLILDVEELGVPRDRIIEALEADGLTGLAAGYANLHLLPMYQEKIAYGSKGFPWTSNLCHREVDYNKGICPVAEKLHETTYLGFEMCLHELSDSDVNLIVNVFHKVWENMGELRA